MIVAQVFNRSYAFVQENVGRTFAREVLFAFMAQSMHIDVVQNAPRPVAMDWPDLCNTIAVSRSFQM